MLSIGRARHPGPVIGNDPVEHLSVEFVNVGGWLTNGDMALDSGAQFLAVAEHRLIPAKTGSFAISCAKLVSSLFGRHRLNPCQGQVC